MANSDRLLQLPVFDFLRRFLQQVLPQGLPKVRHYEFLNRCSKQDLDHLRASIRKLLEHIDPESVEISPTGSRCGRHPRA